MLVRNMIVFKNNYLDTNLSFKCFIYFIIFLHQIINKIFIITIN